jgi:hypothetical protein
MFRKSKVQHDLSEALARISFTPQLQRAEIQSPAPLALVPASSSADNTVNAPPLGKYWLQRVKWHTKQQLRLEKEQHARLRIRNRKEVYMDPLTSGSCTGDMRLSKLNWWLNNLGIQRSPDQAMFHWHFTNAVLPKIYGEKDWNEHSMRVMNQRKLDRIDFEVTIITPRRWGKSWSVAMFVLSLMLAVPGIRICIFSTGKRASSSLMEIITQFMANVPGLNARKVKENQEELYLADAPLQEGSSSGSGAAKTLRQSPHTSKLYCYPCNVTGQNR